MTCIFIRQTPFLHQPLFKVSLKDGFLTQVSLYPVGICSEATFSHVKTQLSHSVGICSFAHVLPAKTLLSLPICSLHCVLWTATDPRHQRKISRHGCTDWSESSHGIHVLINILSHCCCIIDGMAVIYSNNCPSVMVNVLKFWTLYSILFGLSFAFEAICFLNT